jgi:phosphatidate cytidylyltransferase
MTVLFVAVVILDNWLADALTVSTSDRTPVQGTLLCAVVAAVVIAAHAELSRMARAKHLHIFTPVSLVASLLFATGWYWPQFLPVSPELYFAFVAAFSLMALLLSQSYRRGTVNVLANCGASWLIVGYLGMLGGFFLAIRIDFGWPELLLFVFAIKSADIGAYGGGRMFGVHKFSPRISPGKTWEGMAAACAAATVVSVAFAAVFDIMSWWLASAFGFCFAFIGQMGDLAESMIKRDSEVKDSGNKVPGFGGILDIIDSPLAAAPFAYLFFASTCSL